MRKSLSYKILAALMAAGSFGLYAATPAAAAVELTNGQLRANGNAIVIKNNELTEPAMDLSNVSQVYGVGYNYSASYKDDADDGNVTITNSTFNEVYGGYTDGVNGKNTTANNNTVTLNNSNISNVYGGYSGLGSAKKNIVKIDGGNYGVIIGGSSGNNADSNVVSISNAAINNYINNYIIGGLGITNANGNKIEITNSTVSISISSSIKGWALTGGYASSGSASSNQVIITDSTISGNVYGGYIVNATNQLAENNSITITGNSNIANANLYGYATYSGTATGSNNTLTLNGWSGTVNSLHNFDNIIFENIDLSQKEITLNVTGEVSGMDGVTITFGNIKEDSLAAGDYTQGNTATITTIKWDADLGNNVAFGSNFNSSLAQIDTDVHYFAGRENSDGIYVNRFSNFQGTDSNTGDNQAEITATVTKSILTGKFIDESGAVRYNSNQTEDTASLTIGNGFTTNVATVAGIYAVSGQDAGNNGTGLNGVINITGGTTDWKGTVYAGYSEGGSVSGNTINVLSATNAQNMTLKGYNSDSNADGNAASNHNNTLNITGNGNTFNSIEDFDTINFKDVVLNSTDVLTLNSANLTDTTLNVENLADGKTFKAGDTVTLIAGNIEGTPTLTHDKVTAGLSQDLSVEEITNNSSVKLAVKDVSLNDQIDLVAENRAVAAAFVNQGTDLISDSLDALSRDSNYGVKTFAAVHGNRSKYDVNSDIKINGWSVIAGVGNADKFDNGSEFSWGVFYENGSGNYRTFNEFNNEFFRGDGSLVYNGGGIAARYTNKNGVYTEGSLRAGMLKSDMDNALRDGAGNFYGYESESAYYGAHIGIGKIISLSESSDLDVYGKFFHTYTEGDSFKVANDEFEFDSINSDRLRIGARITSNKENKFSTYYGLAYEYEFNGDADMTAQGLKAPTQSLQGSSVMAEVGFNYQPTPDSPWSFDLNMRGYAGERQGGSFNVQATYTF